MGSVKERSKGFKVAPQTAWYFLSAAAGVCIFPFLNPFLEGKGVTRQQIGVISALRPWLSVPATLMWSTLADSLGVHRSIMVFTYAVSLLLRLLLPLANDFWSILGLMLGGQILGAPVGILTDTEVLRVCIKDGDFGRYRLWGAVGWGSFSTFAGHIIDVYGITTAFTLHAVLSIPALAAGILLFNPQALKPQAIDGSGDPCSESEPLLRHVLAASGSDTQLMSSADALMLVDAPDGFPAVGASPAGHTALDPHTDGELHSGMAGVAGGAAVGEQWTAPWCAVLAAEESEKLLALEPAAAEEILLLHSACAHDITLLADVSKGDAQKSDPGHGDACSQGQQPAGGAASSVAAEQSLMWRLWVLLQDPEVLLFFWTTLIMGVGFGVIDSFLFLFLQQLGGSSMLMGATLTMTCVVEVPAFRLQGWLLQRVSLEHMLLFSLSGYIVRMLCYGALPWCSSPWWVLLVEPLHGVTFACGWGAGTVKAKRLAPAGLEATMQGCFQSLYFGLGYGLSALFGGIIVQRYGMQVLYMCGACSVLLGTLVLLLARCAACCCAKGASGPGQYSKLATSDGSTAESMESAATLQYGGADDVASAV